jgi:hypothetical protein
MSNHNQLPNDFPANSVGTPSVAIDWYRAAPWWRAISPVLNISWRASHILLCCLGLLLSYVCSAALLWIFQPDLPSNAMHAAMQPRALSVSPIGLSEQSGAPTLLSVWAYFVAPVSIWLTQPTLRVSAMALAYLGCQIGIWGFIGGCLTRRTVVECGTQMTMPWMHTFQIIVKRLQSIAWSLAMPACALVFVMILPMVTGVVSRLPWIGVIIAFVLLVPTMLAVLAVAWVSAITLLGFPLSVCAIVTERKADAFDGVSRSAAYVFQRPLVFILLITAFQFLSFAASEIFGSILWVGKSFMVTGFDIGASHDMVATQSILLEGIPILLLGGFSMSFFWSAAASIYLVLRREVDRTEYDHIDPALTESVVTSPSNDSAAEIGAVASLPSSDASTDVG